MSRKMPAGYSKNPLIVKLGLKSDMTARFVNAPPHYATLLGAMPPDVRILESARGMADFIHVFVCNNAELTKQLPALKKHLDKAGMLWVSWPKKTSAMFRDVTEDTVRDSALKIGLVDVKVCAVDEDWSGLKLVYRLKDR
jgi:hypothetical protein